MSGDTATSVGPVLMDHEKAAVQQFRERLGDSNKNYDDGLLLRFLVARAMNVVKFLTLLHVKAMLDVQSDLRRTLGLVLYSYNGLKKF